MEDPSVEAMEHSLDLQMVRWLVVHLVFLWEENLDKMKECLLVLLTGQQMAPQTVLQTVHWSVVLWAAR